MKDNISPLLVNDEAYFVGLSTPERVELLARLIADVIASDQATDKSLLRHIEEG